MEFVSDASKGCSRRRVPRIVAVLAATLSAAFAGRATAAIFDLTGTGLYTNSNQVSAVDAVVGNVNNWTNISTGATNIGPGTADEAELGTNYTSSNYTLGLHGGTTATFAYGDLLFNDNASFNFDDLHASLSYPLTLGNSSLTGTSNETEAVADGGTNADLLLLGSKVLSGTTVTVGASLGSGALSLVLGANGGIDVVHSGAVLAIPAVISGSFGLTINGGSLSSGLVELQNASNSFTGGVTIVGGTLQIPTVTALGVPASSPGLTFSGNGTLQLSASGSFSSTYNVQINSTANATIDTNGNNLTVNNTLSGTGAFTKAGAGTLTFVNGNGNLSGFTIAGGTVATAYASGLGTFSAPLAIDNNGVLFYTGTSSTASALKTTTLNGNATVAVASSAGSFAFAGTVTGTGGLTVGNGNAGGAVVLEALNTYYGGTTISLGSTLDINAGGSSASSSIGFGVLKINGGAIDNTVGSLVTLGTNNSQAWNGDFTFVGTGSLNLGTGAVTLGGNRAVTVSANTLTVGGAIGDGGSKFSLTKAGAGVLVLSGSNSYGGGTAITGGVLLANATGTGNSATGSGSVSINNSGVLAGGTAAAPGEVAGAVIVKSGGTITAGTGATSTSTIGTLVTGAQTWNTGGTYVAKVSPGGTVNDDLIMSGLTVAATTGTGNQFSIDLVSQGTTALTFGQQLIIGQISGASQGNFKTADLSLTLTGVTVPTGDSAILVDMTSGGNDDLVVEAAPEPTSALLLGLVGSPLLLARRRRLSSQVVVVD